MYHAFKGSVPCCGSLPSDSAQETLEKIWLVAPGTGIETIHFASQHSDKKHSWIYRNNTSRSGYVVTIRGHSDYKPIRATVHTFSTNLVAKLDYEGDH